MRINSVAIGSCQLLGSGLGSGVGTGSSLNPSPSTSSTTPVARIRRPFPWSTPRILEKEGGEICRTVGYQVLSVSSQPLRPKKDLEIEGMVEDGSVFVHARAYLQAMEHLEISSACICVLSTFTPSATSISCYASISPKFLVWSK